MRWIWLSEKESILNDHLDKPIVSLLALGDDYLVKKVVQIAMKSANLWGFQFKDAADEILLEFYFSNYDKDDSVEYETALEDGERVIGEVWREDDDGAC